VSDDEVIAPGAFGDTPKTVPLRLGQDGPVIGEATVNPDGTVTAVVMSTEHLGTDEQKAVYLGGRTSFVPTPQMLRDQADTQAGNFGEPVDGGCPVCGTPVEHDRVDVTSKFKPPGTEFMDGRWYCPKGHASAPWMY
jgi:hypothetical protein